MATPVVLAPVVTGLPFSGTDANNNLALIENSFTDVAPYVISGLAISIGTGLSVNVALGVAVIGAEITKTSFVIGGLTPSTTVHLYLNQNGTGSFNTTGTAPAKSVKLGTAITGGSTVSSVAMGRTSGRQQFVQPQNLIPGGPSSGTASAGHPDGINLASWGASDAEGQALFGVLPAGAIPATLTAPATITLNDGNQNSVQTALTIGHTYNAGGGAAGIGTEFDLLVESSTNGTNRIAANLQATLTDLTPATATGKLSLGVIANNAQVIPMTVASQDIRIPQATAASSQHGLLNLGSGGFDGAAGHFAGDSPGTILAVNAPASYLGTYLDFQENGVRLLYLDHLNTFYRLGAPVATGNWGQVSIGDALTGFDGSTAGHYVGSASGTYLAVNAGSGFSGHLMNLQVAGVSKLVLGAGGVLTLANKLATPGLQTGQATKTTTYTLLTTDGTILADASGGSFVITLPTAASGAGQIYTIVKKTSTANTVTLQGNGAEVIQTAPGTSANTLVVTTHVQVQSDGVSWYVVA